MMSPIIDNNNQKPAARPLFDFDIASVDPGNGNDPLPAGDYVVSCEAAVFKPTKAGSGSFLELQLAVQGGVTTVGVSGRV